MNLTSTPTAVGGQQWITEHHVAKRPPSDAIVFTLKIKLDCVQALVLIDHAAVLEGVASGLVVSAHARGQGTMGTKLSLDAVRLLDRFSESNDTLLKADRF